MRGRAGGINGVRTPLPAAARFDGSTVKDMNDDIADHLVMEDGTTSRSCRMQPGTGRGRVAETSARPTKKTRRLEHIVGRAQ
ncbi:hypothetical protein PBS_40350 [Paraburkholderia sp. 2C]